jgi:hypothetical protein
MFAAVGGVFAVVGWLLAIMIFIAGRRLGAHCSRTFCIVVAAICCLFMPIGTILGVFTLVVLNRPSVQSLFDRGTTYGAETFGPMA